MSIDLAKQKTVETARWQNAAVWKSRIPELDAIAKKLVAPGAKARYQFVESKTGVPWWVVAIIHEREGSQSWATNLAQGDPWDKISTHEPAGQGPFDSWESAAINALKPYAHWTDWSVGGTLTFFEIYNGEGYYERGLPSPYNWSGTNQYVRGKYIADKAFDPNVIDKQPGCAALIARMHILDQAVGALTFYTIAPVQPPKVVIPSSTNLPAGAQEKPMAGITISTDWLSSLSAAFAGKKTYLVLAAGAVEIIANHFGLLPPNLVPANLDATHWATDLFNLALVATGRSALTGIPSLIANAVLGFLQPQTPAVPTSAPATTSTPAAA